MERDRRHDARRSGKKATSRGAERRRGPNPQVKLRPEQHRPRGNRVWGSDLAAQADINHRFLPTQHWQDGNKISAFAAMFTTAESGIGHDSYTWDRGSHRYVKDMSPTAEKIQYAADGLQRGWNRVVAIYTAPNLMKGMWNEIVHMTSGKYKEERERLRDARRERLSKYVKWSRDRFARYADRESMYRQLYDRDELDEMFGRTDPGPETGQAPTPPAPDGQQQPGERKWMDGIPNADDGSGRPDQNRWGTDAPQPSHPGEQVQPVAPPYEPPPAPIPFPDRGGRAVPDHQPQAATQALPNAAGTTAPPERRSWRERLGLGGKSDTDAPPRERRPLKEIIFGDRRTLEQKHRDAEAARAAGNQPRVLSRNEYAQQKAARERGEVPDPQPQRNGGSPDLTPEERAALAAQIREEWEARQAAANRPDPSDASDRPGVDPEGVLNLHSQSDGAGMPQQGFDRDRTPVNFVSDDGAHPVGGEQQVYPPPRDDQRDDRDDRSGYDGR